MNAKWVLRYYGPSDSWVRTETGAPVVQIGFNIDARPQCAAMIAAAPEMVDALLADRAVLLRAAQTIGGDARWLDEVNGAIGANYAALKKAGAL